PADDSPDVFPTVKLLDLGLARRNPLAGDASGTLTGPGMVMGTPDYVAPEQITDARNADARADLYSLGCTFFHLLTGRPPFGGTALGLKLVQHQTHEPPALDELRPEVPPAVARIVRKMMAKEPQDRPRSGGRGDGGAGRPAPLRPAGEGGRLRGAGRRRRHRHPRRPPLRAGAAVRLASAAGGGRVGDGAGRAGDGPHPLAQSSDV